MRIYEKIKAIRVSLGLSQSEASTLSGLAQKDISLLEKGGKKFIPNEYIHFLYKQGVDINTIFDDNLAVSWHPVFENSSKHNTTPIAIEANDMVSDVKSTSFAPPTKGGFAPATAPANTNLGLPKVVAVNSDNEELVSLVSAKAAAGYLNGYADTEYIEHLPTIKLPNLKGGTHRAFEVKGHSMNPTIHNGAIAVGRWVEGFADIKENYVYIIVTKTDGIVCKRVLNRVEESGKLILKSDNANKKEYPNIILDAGDVVEMWRLRGGFVFEFAEPNEINHRINDLEASLTLVQDQLRKLVK